MEAAELRRRVEALTWFHRIDLGQGIVTPGLDDSPAKLRRIGLPDDLHGRSVLDIGAWDGFSSFEAERRGATRVLATDSFCWGGDGWGSKAGFDLARTALGSRVESLEIDPMDLDPEVVGRFDLVLLLGVLYHLRHPLLALERVFAVTRDQLILESEVDLVDLGFPAMAFYPGSELDGDPTNWWAPNPPALAGMLRAAGFSRVEVVSGPRRRSYRLLRGLAQALRGAPDRRQPQRDRIVVHAWR